MVSFTLKTETQEQKRETNNIIKNLKILFGENEFEIVDYETTVAVESQSDNVKAWIGVNDVAFYGKSRLHIYKDMGIKPNINYDIPLDLCDVIHHI